MNYFKSNAKIVPQETIELLKQTAHLIAELNQNGNKNYKTFEKFCYICEGNPHYYKWQKIIGLWKLNKTRFSIVTNVSE